MPDPLIDTSSAWFNNVVAQLGHFGWGALFICNSYFYFGSPWQGVFALASWVALKEYVIDAKLEGQGFWSNTLDASMYAMGALAQFLIWRLV